MTPAKLDPSLIPHLLSFPAPDRSEPEEGQFFDAANWLATASDDPAILVMGVPFAGGSISKGRMDLAPGAIREALKRFAVWSSDRRIDLAGTDPFDVGDLSVTPGVIETQERVAAALEALLGQSTGVPVILGGDNSITVGAVRGSGADGLLTLDAHHDCRDPAAGLTNGTPVRQLVQDGFGPVFQIGIHGFANSGAHARWAADHQIEWATAGSVRQAGITRTIDAALDGQLSGSGRIWVDFDIDVLDRAFAPGAPAAMPGGLMPADLFDAAFRLGKEPRVVGADIVEVDPQMDVSSITVRAACGVLLSFACGVAVR